MKAEIKRALAHSADEIVAFMKRLAPVLKNPDDRRRAGALRDSIAWTWGKAPEGSFVIGEVRSSDIAGDLTITIYAGGPDDEAFYARFIEFGTQSMKAQPFFYPAYRAMRKRAKSRITRAINKAAKKRAAGG